MVGLASLEIVNPFILTLIGLAAAGSVWAQLSPQPAATVAVPNARHVIGLDNVKQDAAGKLAIQDGALQFDTGQSEGKVPIASVDDVFTGTETTQSGGKTGRNVKIVALAAPYYSGKLLTLFMRTKVDILTVAFHDADGALESAIFEVPVGQAAPMRTQLIQAGAQTLLAAGSTPPTAAIGSAQSAAKAKLSASAIQIAMVETSGVQIPAEFRFAVYERLVERVRASGAFPKVYRAGDRAAAGISDLVTLRTQVDAFKEGSQTKRELTTVAGATKVGVTAAVTARDGHTLVAQNITGQVHYFGDNLGVTNDVAKRIVKLLRQTF